MAVFYKTGHFKSDPEMAWREISALEEITPDNVVELARNESSCLHVDFDWDDAVAGKKWRHKQAQVLLANLVVEVEEPEKQEPVAVRLLHTTPDRTDYKPIEFFMSHEDEREKLLKQAYADLEAFKRKYYTLKELQPIFDVVNTL